ncbi:MAG: (E)-4-hydroxy-3-methylbut-2-enyl-diphosphate synthase [Bacteroidetes bacterium]|nr:(E)-4-hydroxy-3-methylbut-2-enyl-diphosphate synthase [Bacteroidota bacterium]
MPKLFQSRTINIGPLALGGDSPVRIQSMTNTDTNQVEESVKQCIRMIDAGAELVRLTTQGSREVQSLAEIREALRRRGYNVPLAADIHFRAGLALEAAPFCEKIRINPGNYLKGSEVESLLPELLQACKENRTTIRIGVNHGSLDESILREFGDTPKGMVESAMQFLRICKKEKMERVVVSMKSSNPRVMIYSVRLLAKTMLDEQMDYPIHLGVTEAGDGMDGVIKSVVGIAPLLLEGLGDTIRVSLTAPPEEELPVARKIVELFPKPAKTGNNTSPEPAWDPFSYNRRISEPFHGMGLGTRVKIISNKPPLPQEDLSPGQLASGGISYEQWKEDPQLLKKGNGFLLLEKDARSMEDILTKLNEFCLANHTAPILYKTVSAEREPELFAIQLAGEIGSVLMDGVIDAIRVENPYHSEAWINETLLTIFQAAGARITKTEYIACPSCGRTHFDIVHRLKEIREATTHLEPIKIGVMGCIVNGPGEMADADYGYVGAGRGRVSIYKGKIPVRLNLPEEEALAALVDLMKKEGDWQDPKKPGS